MRKGLIFTGFLCLLVLYLSAPVFCFSNEASDADADQKLLGDESDGSRAHPIHLIPLLAENEDGEKGEKITFDDDPLLPFSTRWTCGDCHSYGVIAKGWHFNAVDPNVPLGRPGQPWILTHARTGTQIPLSYRPWPGTFRPEQVGLPPHEFTRYFGRHMPGGGQGEISSEDPDRIMREYITGKLEINCLSCHNANPAHNQGEYYPQTVRENFRWAAAATCGFASVSGSARDMSETYDPFMPEPLEDPKKVPPTVTYRENTFDHENNVSFDIVREVPNNRCYFCHSNMDIDKEDAEKWTSDEDIHLTAGLKCVDCHRNGIDHNTIRGYDEEAGISDNPIAATSSCKGCHLPEGEGVPEAGRLGAPIPTHPGIPTVHFDKLTCTACHSGPWPGKKTILTKTSRAHRLGTVGVNKSHEALPHINSPVFAQQPNGKIAPHKLLWPSYWATIEDQNVAPIAFEKVIEVVGPAFADMRLPASGDWPEMTVEHIVKGIETLAASVEGTPVYISAGKLYKLDDSGKLSEEEHPAARPYLWPLAHDVRPAAQSLGVRYCTDCHDTQGPFFFGEVAVDSPIAAQRDNVKNMVEFLKVRPFYTKAFAFSFVFRPWMKIICLASSAVLAGVLLLYALRMLACIAKALTERD